MPGYWKDPDRTAAAFDAEGFYCMGDAVALVDAGDPSRGFDFAGRLTEDFKLSTGTWVRVGPLRTSLLAHLGALAQDVVIAGHDRDAIGVLVFPAMAACRRLAGADDAATARQVLGTPVVVERLLAALADFSDGHAGSSTRVACAVLVEEPPSIDANEITDKGTVNQRAVLRNRPALVDRLFGAPGDAIRVVVPQRSAQP
jgi:feruloyl-CoA synthase